MKKAQIAAALMIPPVLVALVASRDERAATESTPKEAAAARYPNLPLAFEPNRGQAGPSVRYLARGSGYSLLVRSQDALLALGKKQALRLGLIGASKHARVLPELPLPGKVNYLLGNERSR